MHRRQNSQRTLFVSFVFFLMIAFTLATPPRHAIGDSGGGAGKASLTADRLDYNPQTNRIDARGNVHMTRPDGELFGDTGTGTTDGRRFQLDGNVRGHFSNEELDIACDHIILVTDGMNPARRIITASGDAELTRRGDRITARLVYWELNRNVYKATGDVIGNYAHYYIDADEISRDNNQFTARTIRRYHDKERNVTLSASRATGTLSPDGVITELVAEGGVMLDTLDKRGVVSRITGDKGIFSVARGTLVVSGNAMANQSGRNLHAESIVYHLDSERIEAIGRPSLVIDIPN